MAIWSLHLGRNSSPRFPHRAPARRANRPRTLSVGMLEDRCLLSASLWTQRGGDAGHTAYVDTTLNPANLAVAWNAPFTYQASGSIFWAERAVAIDDARVYRTALEDFSLGGTYHVLAYDLQTGAQLWDRTLTGNAFEGVGEPSVAGGLVDVNRAGHSGISGGSEADWPRIYAFNALTGATVIDRKYEEQWASNERPVIDNNQLVVQDGYYGGVAAYTASTLTKQWFTGGPQL